MTEEDIRKIALEILENGDMEELTAKKVRKLVSEKTGVDMASTDKKQLILDIVDDFVVKRQREKSDRGEKRSTTEESDDEGSREKKTKKRFKAGESGELIVCEVRIAALFTARRMMYRLVATVLYAYPFDSLAEGFIVSSCVSSLTNGTRVVDIVCMYLQLSAKRKVSVNEFKGRMLVSIREYYEKNGKELPSSKGKTW